MEYNITISLACLNGCKDMNKTKGRSRGSHIIVLDVLSFSGKEGNIKNEENKLFRNYKELNVPMEEMSEPVSVKFLQC